MEAIKEDNVVDMYGVLHFVAQLSIIGEFELPIVLPNTKCIIHIRSYVLWVKLNPINH